MGKQVHGNVYLKNKSNLAKLIYAQLNSKNKNDALKFAIETANKHASSIDVNEACAILCLSIKNIKLAQKYLLAAISLAPTKIDNYLLLADIYKNNKKHQQAINLLAGYVKLYNSNDRVNLLLADLNLKLKKYYLAIKYAKQALEKQPDNALLLLVLLKCYTRTGDYICAQDVASKLESLSDDNTKILDSVGYCYLCSSQLGKALSTYQKLLYINNNHRNANKNIAAIFCMKDDIRKAETYIEKYLQIDPNDCDALRMYVYISQNCRPEILVDIQRRLKSEDLSINDKISLYFAAGKVSHNLEAYEKAWQYFQKANNLSSQMSSKFIAKQETLKNKICKLFNKRNVKKIITPEIDFAPLFVLGMPRSGKTTLMRYVSQSNEVYTNDEKGFLRFSEYIPNDIIPFNLDVFPESFKDTEDLLKIRDLYVKWVMPEQKGTYKYVADTAPSNIYAVGILAKLFPNAKFIFCQREIKSLIFEIFTKYFTWGHKYSNDIEKAYQYNKIYDDLIVHWLKALGDRALLCKFEELSQSPQDTLNAINEFLTLKPYNHSELEYHVQDNLQFYPKYLEAIDKIITKNNMPQITQEVYNAIVDKDILEFASDKIEAAQYDLAKRCCEFIISRNKNDINAKLMLLKIKIYDDQSNVAEDELLNMHKLAPENDKILSLLVLCLNLQDKKMDSEYYQQKLNSIRSKKQHDAIRLSEADVGILSAAFYGDIQKVSQNKLNVLYSDNKLMSDKVGSYVTCSWDRYFNDLSHASFRSINNGIENKWRMRAWYFAFKNISLANYLYNTKKKQVNLLDIGCSTGYLRRILEGNFNPVENKKIYYWGIDVRQEVLKQAVLDENNIESSADSNYIPAAFIAQDITQGLPYKDESFDVVVSFEMIKYLPVNKLADVLQNIYRVLDKTGKFYFSTTFAEHHVGFVEAIPPEQMVVYLEQAGFKVLKRYGTQTSFKELFPHLSKEHGKLAAELMQFHPEEMVIAMLSPLYPQHCSQVTYICSK